jgi:serine/threonine protein phosphatase PrpC
MSCVYTFFCWELGGSDRFQANAGDSRSVISVKGEVKPLSFDHKPSNEGPLATSFLQICS